MSISLMLIFLLLLIIIYNVNKIKNIYKQKEITNINKEET